MHIEVRPNHAGDFDPIVTDRGAGPSGSMHVQFGYQTASARDGGKGGIVIATDTVTQRSTPPLPVLIFPPVLIDNN